MLLQRLRQIGHVLNRKMNAVKCFLIDWDVLTFKTFDSIFLAASKQFHPEGISWQNSFQIIKQHIFELVYIHLIGSFDRQSVVCLESTIIKSSVLVRLAILFEMYKYFFQLRSISSYWLFFLSQSAANNSLVNWSMWNSCWKRLLA